jgi:cell wall assembly regulator SMI1
MPTLSFRLSDLGDALRTSAGWESANLEIHCRSSGDFRMLGYPGAVSPVGGHRDLFEVVIDPDYRMPEAGAFQDAGTAGPAGDPELAVSLFHEYMRRRAEVLGHEEPLPPPASAEALDDAEARIGRALPADLRALYSIADGDGIDYQYIGLFSYGWMSLKEVVDSYQWVSKRAWYRWDLCWDAVVQDAEPPETVRRCAGHPDWIAFATAEDGNYLAVDLAPARHGRPGQVIGAGRDHDDGPGYYADSVTSLLARHLDMLDRGLYEVRYGNIIAFRPTARPLSGPGTAIRGLPYPVRPNQQEVIIIKAESPVDLTQLTACPILRRLRLSRCSTDDLAPLRTLPVESLGIALDGTGPDALVPLADHPHLTALELSTTGPVDLGPLRTVPNLRGLNLSEAEVSDLTVLRDLRGLRFLALSAQQWDMLLEQDAVPSNLAAAHLTEAAGFEDALTWAAQLRPDPIGALRLSGTLTAADKP